MADNGGSNAMLGLILGGLLVFVVLVFVYGWAGGPGTKSTNLTIETPKINVVPKSN